MFHIATLANGLTVIAEVNERAASAAGGFFVKTGARDESPQLSGVSHFLEHMMFKGTKNRSALDVTFALGKYGAQANAFTSEESTVYYYSCLPEYFGQIFEIYADMLQPALDQAEFDTEKGVILEEIALYQDRPTHVLFESAMKTFFGNNPAGNSVLGSVESVGALTREQMLDYFSERYVPSNMVLAASGNVCWEKFLADAEKYCGGWEDRPTARFYQDFTAEEKQLSLIRENLQSSHLCLISAGPSATDEERYVANVLACILGDSSGSRLYWELVNPGIADSASVSCDDMDRTGLIYAYASCDPANMQLIADGLGRVLGGAASVTEDELHRALTKLRTRIVLQGESSLRRLVSIGLGWIYRRDYRSLDSEIARYGDINLEQVKQAARYFTSLERTAVTMVPAGGNKDQ
ncbi:MAG: pitrilysin family protein [bacterium]|nr:pitrilysin family protein [bacterium]